MGDPAGVGGELSLLAWQRRHESDLPPFFCIDDPARLARLAGALGWQVPITEIETPEEAIGAFPGALPVLPQTLPALVEPGTLNPANGSAVIASIERAVSLAREGTCSAVVTNPIHKATLYQTGFAFPGHTEFLAALCGGHERPVMMLAIDGLRVVPATVHIPLSEVARRLTPADLIAIGQIIANALHSDFAVDRPRLAVAGLNPHAGEDGKIGQEEAIIIAPAIEALRAEGITVFGPAPADSLFHADARPGYDAALCMYHDQALIPLKTLDFFGGVNVTLGLPIIRTSPDHGTALGIAGTGAVRPDSFLRALTMASEIAANRATAKAAAA